MPLELHEDSFGDPRNARFLVRASDFAYLPAGEGPAKFQEELGLNAELISVGNTQVYVGENSNNIVVAFRGTENPASIEGLKDWLLTNALNLLIVPEGRLGTDFIAAGVGARFHQGFINALASVWDPLFSRVEAESKKSDRPLWITGHSLGGALALLSAWLFQRKFISVHQVYTFGAPMIGNAIATQAFNKELKGKVFRYVNEDDPVPLLPTISLLANDFAHCERQMGLKGGGSSASSLFTALASKAVGGMMDGNMMNDVWAEINTRVSSHFVPSYENLVEQMSQTA